ncbi:CdaR family protein [Eubacterium aggregans]|uniref:CdaR family protein n=1 Tax=Eubacterium aggregans TaxID=81409 RepID=UPI003F3CC984
MTNQKKKHKANEKIIRMVLAICAAIVLWLYINGSSIDLVTQDLSSIPVTFTNLNVLESKGLTLNDSRSYYVNLRVRGTEKKLDKLDPTKISAQVDLKDIDEAGNYNPEIVVHGLSNSVILEEIKPATLSLQVDRFNDKDFPVTVNTDGKPADDNAVVSATTDEKVTIDGTNEDFAKVKSVVAVVNVQGLTEDSIQYATVNAYDENGNTITGLDIEPRAVRVNIVIGKTKTVKIKAPSTTGDVATGYKVTGVTVTPNNKLIGGKQSALDALSELSVENVGVTGATTNVTKEVKLKLPDGVYFMDGSDSVTVSVNVEEEVEKSYTVDSIET